MAQLALFGGEPIRKLPFPKHPIITSDEKTAVLEVLDSGNLSTFIASSGEFFLGGKKIKEFEKKFAQKLGTKFAVAFNSATSALHAAVVAIDVKPGEEVIVPPYTFTSTATSVLMHNAIPVFADVKNDTFCIDPKSIEKNITKLTKGITAVHLFGHPCDMDEIMSIAKKNKLKVIEDCAHSLGSKFNNSFCGNIGDVGCFSFYPTKIITTGEGGMITTNKNNLLKKFKQLRSQGMDITPNQREKLIQWKYDIVDLGYNYRLDEIRSSLGLSQLNRINNINKLRIKIANKYNKLLKNIKGISLPVIKSNRNHIFHLYSIKIEKEYYLQRDELFKKLSDKGIGTSVQYYPLHLMSYNKNKYNNLDFPVANKIKDKILCLPIFPTMTEKQIQYVASNLLN